MLKDLLLCSQCWSSEEIPKIFQTSWGCDHPKRSNQHKPTLTIFPGLSHPPRCPRHHCCTQMCFFYHQLKECQHSQAIKEPPSAPGELKIATILSKHKWEGKNAWLGHLLNLVCLPFYRMIRMKQIESHTTTGFPFDKYHPSATQVLLNLCLDAPEGLWNETLDPQETFHYEAQRGKLARSIA